MCSDYREYLRVSGFMFLSSKRIPVSFHSFLIFWTIINSGEVLVISPLFWVHVVAFIFVRSRMRSLFPIKSFAKFFAMCLDVVSSLKSPVVVIIFSTVSMNKQLGVMLWKSSFAVVLISSALNIKGLFSRCRVLCRADISCWGAFWTVKLLFFTCCFPRRVTVSSSSSLLVPFFKTVTFVERDLICCMFAMKLISVFFLSKNI